MDIGNLPVIGAAVGASVIGLSFAYARTIVRNAVERATNYERWSERVVDARTVETLMMLDRTYAEVRERFASQGFDVAALAGERAILSDMVDELRQERDDLEGELAAYKVDAIEQAKVADTFSRQTMQLDNVIDHLTAQIGEARLTVVLPGNLGEIHAESLIRIGLRGRYSRGPATIGRAA